jgi:hypothetical protein
MGVGVSARCSELYVDDGKITIHIYKNNIRDEYHLEIDSSNYNIDSLLDVFLPQEYAENLISMLIAMRNKDPKVKFKSCNKETREQNNRCQTKSNIYFGEVSL